MRYIYTSLAIIFLFLDLASAQKPDLGKSLASEILLSGIKEIVSSKEAEKYFGSLDLSAVQLRSDMVNPNASGWIVRWRFEVEIIQKLNPNNQSGRATIPGTDSETGILFDIFIASEGATSGLEANGGIRIPIDSPRIQIGYYLATKNENQELRRLINSVCRQMSEKFSVTFKAAPAT